LSNKKIDIAYLDKVK